MTDDREELLTLPEFARLFHTTAEAARKRARKGWEAAHLVGGRWYIVLPARLVLAARNRSNGQNTSKHN